MTVLPRSKLRNLFQAGNRRALPLVTLAWGGFLSLNLACQTPQGDLLQELKRRREQEGLALIRIQSNWMYTLSFDGQVQDVPNPREISNAWFSGDGRTVVWDIHRWPGKEFSACPAPVTVEMLDEPGSRQLPGNVVNVQAMAVSSDGKHVAFDGTYRSQATGFLAMPKNHVRSIVGLQYVDLTTNTMKLVLPLSGPDRVTSISFSPDGTQFVYDYKSRIYIYNTSSGSSRPLAAGQSPTWSPNGKWIALRLENGDAVTLDAATFETTALIGRRKIQTSVLWSPDSQYVAFAEPLGLISNVLHGRNPLSGAPAQMVVERIEDHATAVIYLFQFEGIDDRGFYWIPDYRAFMPTASNFPALKACDHSD